MNWNCKFFENYIECFINVGLLGNAIFVASTNKNQRAPTKVLLGTPCCASVWAGSDSLAVNSKYVASSFENGNNVLVTMLEDIRCITKESPYIKAHGKQILDLSFSPFNNEVILLISLNLIF